jgi:glycosyltransferase involved in cell wall biosynthesis
MNNTILVSIIIPCYNQSQYLSEALQSVVNQSYKNTEIVVVNDGSDDVDDQKLISICSQYGAIANIKYISIPNSGVAIARNIAIQQSAGAYVVPLDADDIIHPRFIEETLLELESSSSASFVYTDYVLFGDVNQNVLSEEYDIYKYLYERNISASTAIIRKTAWQEAGGYNPNMIWGFEDWEFWIACGAKGHFGKRLAKPLFYYRKKISDATRNTGANANSKKLFARMTLNHPTLFPLGRLAWARAEWASAIKNILDQEDKLGLRFIRNMNQNQLLQEVKILGEMNLYFESEKLCTYWLRHCTIQENAEINFALALHLEHLGRTNEARKVLENLATAQREHLPSKIALKRLGQQFRPEV